MPVPGNVHYFPQTGYHPPQILSPLQILSTFTGLAVLVVLISLFAFTLGITARSIMDLPRMGILQTTVLEIEQVCRDIAGGAKMRRKGG